MRDVVIKVINLGSDTFGNPTCRYVSSPSWFGVEQSWVLCDVVILVSDHVRQSVIFLNLS